MTQAKAITKKDRIIEVARALGKDRYTPAEIEQIRRQLIAHLGGEGKTSSDYIASVLDQAGLRVILSPHVAATERYEEEFQDLLHFSTIEEAEMCIVRLDELLRKFQTSQRKCRRRTGAGSRTPGSPPCGDDRPQSESGREQTRGKGRDRPLVCHLAGNPRYLFRLAGGSRGSRPIFSSGSVIAPLTGSEFEPPGSGAPRPRPRRKGSQPGIN